MTITWQQMGIALFAALALHGGLAIWLTWPSAEKLPPELPVQPMKVSLLAVIEQTTTAAVPVTPPPKPPTPKPSTPKPVSPPKPKPIAEPVIQQAEPEPIPEPLPIEEPPAEPVAIPEPIPETIPEIIPKVTDMPPLDTIASVQYEQLLVAWLEKHKKYPRRAKRLRIEGEGRLRISIDRSGQTQKIILEQQTGNRLLDKTALEMAERANPFPPMPDNDPRQALEFIVPVVFALR